MRAWMGMGVAAACLTLASMAPAADTTSSISGASAPAKTAPAADAAKAPAAIDRGDGAWTSVGRTTTQQRFSPLKQVNTATVHRLGLAWHHQFTTDRGQEATPVVVDGVLYTTTAWSHVYAFDARSGKLLWSYDPKVDGSRGFSACCDVANRGVAVWDGKVYAAALDGRLTALDAKTGKIVWSTLTVDQSKPYTITGAPRVVKGRILIGNGGAEYGVRGYLSAYDGKTGKLAWRFYTTPNPQGKPDGAASDEVLAGKAAPTWGTIGVPASGGGGTVWESVAFDPELNLVYFGAGNGSPWNANNRSDGKSDNLFLSSIIAVNADTGKYAWHYQATPDDSWDYDATQHLMQADLTIDGHKRKVLMQANKNGFFYVLDRATGELISAKNYVTTTWASGVDLKTGRPIETPDARYHTKPAVVAPAPYGGHNWQPMAFDPNQGLVFIPAMDAAYGFANDPTFKNRDGAWNTGLDSLINDLPSDAAQQAALAATLKGMLIAWDPVKQEARWTVPHDHFWNAGLLATAGNLVFQGDAEGKFAAYDSRNGKRLWSYDAGNGVIAGASSYTLDGSQYVAIMVGYGGAAPLAAHWTLPNRPRMPGRLLVFKLDGTDHAPAYPKQPTQVVDLSHATSAGDPEAGRVLYGANCLVCHSAAASGHYLPNLRNSTMLTSAEAFKAVVLDGGLSSRGMASFSRFISPADAESIRAYILKLAKDQPPAK